jgi:large subunit ribosomal protein L35
MPKLKTKKGLAKRVRLSKRGKIKYSTCGKSHLATGKTSKRLRSLRRPKTVDGKQDIRYIKNMLPYR